MMGIFRVGSIAAGAALALVSAGPVAAQTVKVGSKNFTEQYIVAEIYAAALEGGGIKVERKINLGGTLIAHQALTTGEIDMYPEYTGTALSAVVKGEVSSDPQKVYDQVKDFYEKQYKITWLKPTAINNGYVIVVRQDTADKYHLKTLSDLGKAAGELTLGAGPEFSSRADGIPGLKKTYDIDFKEFKQFAKLGLRYDALSEKQIDVANGAATDWQIAKQKLVKLDDDKNFFPPYYLTPVVRDDALAANPKVAEILNRVSALLDTDTMRSLNARVEVDHEEAKDVAHDFLREKGVLK
jgi:osmoprotectant transport system substrate-binding protein